jgi:hypothetical protein
MRTALVASLCLAFIGGAALAETKAPPPSDQAPASLAQAPASTLVGAPMASSMKRGRNGKGGRRLVADKRPESPRTSSASDALSSCLAMWEPATHMTKRQWSRACQRVAERLKDTTIK